MMSPIDVTLSWILVLLVIIGLFMAGLRVLKWYRSNNPPPREPPAYCECELSLRRDK